MPSAKKMKTSIPKRYGKANVVPNVKKLVKQAMTDLSETKSFIHTNTMTLNQNVPRVESIMGLMAQGDDAADIIGEKLFIKNIRVRGQLLWVGGLLPAESNTQRIVRIVVFHTKTKLTTTQTALTVSELFRQDTPGTDGNNLAAKAHIDLHKVDLLYDKLIVIQNRDQPTTAAVAPKIVPFSFNLKINKTKYVEDENASYHKDGMYYMAIVYDDTQASIGGIVAQYTMATNFKDM